MDIVSNTLARVKNASMSKKKTVEVVSNRLVRRIISILKDESFIEDYKEDKNKIVIVLKYIGKEPAINSISRISKPGRKIFLTCGEIKPVLRGRGIGIISNSSGVMTLDEAREKGLGGEYICEIW